MKISMSHILEKHQKAIPNKKVGSRMMIRLKNQHLQVSNVSLISKWRTCCCIVCGICRNLRLSVLLFWLSRGGDFSRFESGELGPHCIVILAIRDVQNFPLFFSVITFQTLKVTLSS